MQRERHGSVILLPNENNSFVRNVRFHDKSPRFFSEKTIGLQQICHTSSQKNKKEIPKYDKMFLTTKTIIFTEVFPMTSIAQEVKFKQSVIKYSYRNGVTAASHQYRIPRKTIYRWRERYDGTMGSLINKSRRPHRSPNAHTAEEIKLIKDFKYKNKDTGLVVLWVKLRRAGYTRSVTSLYRVMIKLGIYKKTPSKKKKYEPKPYEQMRYPGQRIQVDVKFVPQKCMTKELITQGERYYQFTALDEYTRLRILWFTKENSSYEASKFVDVIERKFPFKIECIQTDNGFEFTNRLHPRNVKKKTWFELKLEEKQIHHKLIKPYTPRHNGKVERSHRKDQERFYYQKIFCSFDDLVNRAKYWVKEYNNFPMRPLNWLSPREKYIEYIQG